MSDVAVRELSIVIVAFFAFLGPIVLALISLRREMRLMGATVTVIKKQTDGLISSLIDTNEEKARMQIDAAALAAKEEERKRGEAEAATLEKGRRAGMEEQVSRALGPAEAPVPVTDKAADRTATATEELAKAATKAAEKPS